MTYTRRRKIEAKYVTKKHGNYHPNFDLKTCVHISLEMLGSYFVSNCREFRYFRYVALNVNKTKLASKNTSRLVDDMHDRNVSIKGNIMIY